MLRTPLARLRQTSRLFLTRPQSTMSTDDAPRPTGLIASKGLELLTWGTPNGHKASIILEELKQAYGTQYVFQGIDISKNIQKEPWFTKLGPNGRIPVLVDHDQGSFPIQEGAAILSYLARHYDPDHQFSFTDALDVSRAEQWIAWQHGGLGPMQGQANHFFRFAPEKIPYGIQRYVGEAERLYGVLNTQLADRDYLVGPGRGKYSIADIANFSWVNFSMLAGLDLAQFPHLQKWWERIAARPAVQQAVTVPKPSFGTNAAWTAKLKEDSEFAQKEVDLKELLKKAKEQYNYVYKSP